MADYRIETRLRSGEYVATLPYRNIQFEQFLNKPGGLRFALPLYHDAVTPQTLIEGLHETWVYKNDQLIFAGPLWDVTPTSQNKSISCAASTLEDYLDVRRINMNVTKSQDQVDHAWELITHTQDRTGGQLYITRGTAQTGVTRERTWSTYDGKYILEAIQDMSEEEDGFDFYITPDRKFHCFYPRPRRNVGLTLTYPTTIRRYSVNKMGKWLRNDILVQGPDPVYKTAVDTASRNKYGLREHVAAYKDASNVNQVTKRAGKIRDDRRRPRYNYSVSIDTTVIDIFDDAIIKFGDVIKLEIQDGHYVDVAESFRYVGHQVTVSEQGSESVVLYLNDLREVED